MQLIAGRTAQEYNQRKGKQGAFWEDRYHATAQHLHRCLVYIVLNMVRAGAVNHPGDRSKTVISRFKSRPGMSMRYCPTRTCGVTSNHAASVHHRTHVRRETRKSFRRSSTRSSSCVNGAAKCPMRFRRSLSAALKCSSPTERTNYIRSRAREAATLKRCSKVSRKRRTRVIRRRDHG